MQGMREVTVDSIPLDRLAGLLAPDRVQRIEQYSKLAREMLDGRIVWNVNATATGGGVAEMLQALLAYGRGAGVDTRWLVLNGTPEFFALTKRIHNLLHGSAGDGLGITDADRATYDSVLAANLESMRQIVRPGDVVVLHDPQTAGLVSGLQDAGVHVVWRSHVGRDETNEHTELVWDFLWPYVAPAKLLIFTREEYVPAAADRSAVRIIPPSLDPFTAKNGDMSEPDVRATLRQAGLVDVPADGGSLEFVRRDGAPGTVRPHSGLIVGDQIVPGDARYVLQVSRWDRLKDMTGVLKGFVDALDTMPDDVHLMLVGPDVSGVTDDPEGAEVLQECLDLWQAQSDDVRRRVHLCSLPMDDIDENAYLVNALQRRASVVVQKSLVEGFGLTVTEPMWKGRPVVGSRIGGIQDQIVHQESGLLLDDPYDLGEFAGAVRSLLEDQEYAERLGAAAKERVREHFLGDRHLIQYVELFGELLG